MNIVDRALTPRTVFVLCALAASLLVYVTVEAAPQHLSAPPPSLEPTGDPVYENGYPMNVTDAYATPGIVVDGSLECFIGGDAWCQDPGSVLGSSSCSECPKP